MIAARHLRWSSSVANGRSSEDGSIGRDLVENGGGGEDGGHAGAGMRAGADEEQVCDVAAVVRTKVSDLPQQRLQAEPGAVRREQLVAEVERRRHARDD